MQSDEGVEGSGEPPSAGRGSLGDSSGNPHPNAAAQRVSNLRAMQAKARRRADQAMHAYTDALGELREELHASPFAAWTLEQLQEFFVDNNLEVRGASMLARSSYVTLLEKMFKGCTEPPNPPPPLTAEIKRKRNKAARMVQDAWFLKKRARWTNGMKGTARDSDGHLAANALHSPRGVMRAAIRGRISEDTPWNPPSVVLAKEFENASHPRLPQGGKFDVTDSKTGRYCFLGGCGEQLDLWDEGQVSQFAPYGAGVTSYFKFVKFCCWSFLAVTVAVVPHLFVNINGDAITTVTTNTGKLAWTTVGNLGSRSNSTDVVLPFCDEEQYSTCIVDKETLGIYYGYIDAFMTMLLLAGYFWVSTFIYNEFATIKRNTVTAGDFTVMVKNLPRDVTEKELSDHFSTILDRKVVEVSIARDNRKCIGLYAQSGRLYHQRAATRDLIRYLKTELRKNEERELSDEENLAGVGADGRTLGSSRDSPKSEGCLHRWLTKRKIRKLQKERENASRKIIHLAAEARLAVRLKNPAMAAFITFEEEMGAIDARVHYSHSWVGWLCMSSSMKVRGRRITVTVAPEPSTILWENYGHKSWKLFMRRTFTFVVGASFVTLSIAMSIMALYQNQVAEQKGGTGECPADWNTLNEQEQIDAVTEDGSILYCLCADRDSSIIGLDTDDVCYEYNRAAFEATYLVLGTSLMVAFTNAVINKITKMMGAFDKHRSMDDQEVSIFRRLVVLKFVNIGLTVLFTNSRRVINVVGVDLEYEEDFSSEWYRTLGSSLVLNVLLNAVTPHLYWLGMWAKKKWNWDHSREKAISQDALNALTKGGRWEISVRYAEITVIFAVCLAYSAGIPILLPVGAVSFLLFYWVEKALFVNFYITPPQYSGKLTKEVISLIPYYLWIHVVFAVFMYGNGSVFPSNVSGDTSTEDAAADASDTTNVIDMIKVKAVQPLLIPFSFLSALIAERWLGNTLISGFAKVAMVFCCRGKIATEKLQKMCNTVTVDYSRATVRGILRGLPSYNILLNPKYKESFGLSDSFACQHKRVGSIFMMLREHPSIVDMSKIMHQERAAKHKSPSRVRKKSPGAASNTIRANNNHGGHFSSPPSSLPHDDTTVDKGINQQPAGEKHTAEAHRKPPRTTEKRSPPRTPVSPGQARAETEQAGGTPPRTPQGAGKGPGGKPAAHIFSDDESDGGGSSATPTSGDA